MSRQDEIKKRARKWRLDHIDRKLESNRAWAVKNKDKMAKAGRESKERRRQNPSARLCDSVSAAIRFSIKARKAGRSWESLLGYSGATLKAHLERQFVRGMSWDNYGAWHIDHILPVSGFSFASPLDADFKACWALSNLRPMWAADNIRKSDQRLHLI